MRHLILFSTSVMCIFLISCQSTRSTGISTSARYKNYNLNSTPPKRDAYIPPMKQPEKEIFETTKPVVIQRTYYVVKKGDTLSSISRRSGLTVNYIKKVNKLSRNLINPGDRIYLPGVNEMAIDPVQRASYNRNSTNHISPKAKSYTLLKRSSWTNTKVKSNITKMGSVNKITVHHSSEAASATNISDKELINRIAKYHRNKKNWAAIGYHYIIGRDGRVYEGRPVQYQGAHASGWNRNNIGIVVLGDFNKVKPSAKQTQTLYSLLNDLRQRYKLSHTKVFGHQHLGQTLCPGKYLYPWVKRYKSL